MTKKQQRCNGGKALLSQLATEGSKRRRIPDAEKFDFNRFTPCGFKHWYIVPVGSIAA
jgi:hypothetical protein